MSDCVEVVVTAEDAEWLAEWTRQLVEDRLVACGHNIASIRATYRWEGEIHDDPQARVALHTRAELVPEIVARANEDHADDVPCVIAFPISGGHPEYLKWVHDETRAPQVHDAIDEVTVFRAKLDQRLAWAKRILRPEPEEMHAMADEVRRATDWESLPESMRSFIERAEAQQPRPGAE